MGLGGEGALTRQCPRHDGLVALTSRPRPSSPRRWNPSLENKSDGSVAYNMNEGVGFCELVGITADEKHQALAWSTVSMLNRIRVGDPLLITEGVGRCVRG